MLNNKTRNIVIVLFAILLAAVLIIKLTNINKHESNFQSELINFNKNDIITIEITSMNEPDKILTIQKTEKGWKAEKDGKSYTADTVTISQMLKSINNMKAEQVVSTTEDDWGTYQVDDTSGTRLTIKSKDKTLADVYIGKFDYTKPTNPYDRQGKMTSYVRPAHQNVTYAVDGFLRMSVNSDINTYRNHNLFYRDNKDITRLTFTYPGDSSFVLEKQNNTWMINDSIADSVKVSGYLKRLNYLASTNYMDEPTVRDQKIYSLRIEGNNMVAPVKITATPADTVNQYYINSSYNPESYFSGAKNNLFQTIFKRISDFK